MNFKPEDVVAVILALLVGFQMALTALARYNGIEIQIEVVKEILLVIIGGLLVYIANKSKKE